MKESVFVCFHGSFQKPLFPHRVVPPSTTILLPCPHPPPSGSQEFAPPRGKEPGAGQAGIWEANSSP